MSSGAPLIRLQSASKRYALRQARFGGRAARALMLSWASESKSAFWALRDIDLEIGPGHTLGVIGVNGSGKSTLLKLMAGVSRATSGSVQVVGRTVGLLELGAGFHPDLTGFQNIYLQCNLMGMRGREVDQRLEAIVEFSGLRHCLDWPVKRYSSGMYARLAFSVAVHADAHIVLIDEILAVGDADFQRRGLARMREIQARGDSILVLVTHDIDLVRGFCDEAIWLDEGRIAARGEPVEVCQQYWDAVLPKMLEASGMATDRTLCERALAAREADGGVRITGVEFRDGEGRRIETVRTGEPWALAVTVEAREAVDHAVLDAYLATREQLISAEIHSDTRGESLALSAGRNVIMAHLEPPMHLEADLSATVLLHRDRARTQVLDAVFRQGRLRIENARPQPFYTVITPPSHWRFEGMQARNA